MVEIRLVREIKLGRFSLNLNRPTPGFCACCVTVSVDSIPRATISYLPVFEMNWIVTRDSMDHVNDASSLTKVVPAVR